MPLPRSGFESWENYPEFPDRGTDRCPAEDSWGLDLWTKALTQAPWGGDGSNWWLHFLDDTANSLNHKVRANAIDPGNEGLLPVSFVHAQTGREIKPWMDFFAYWQAYQVAELLSSATRRYYVTPGFEKRLAVYPALELVAASARSIRKRWEKRRPTFEWLSRFRTILAAGMVRESGDSKAIAKDNAQFKLGKGGIQVRAMSGLDRLKEKSKLLDLDMRGPLFVCPTDIGSGSDDADYFAAAHANFIIARNYAAHHDSLDEAFVVPDLDPSRHLGRIAMQSTVTVVLTSLQTA